MEDIKGLIIKAKALKQSKQVTEAISLLNKAHDIGISTNDVENLVDIHNQLMLLHYQNNDPESFQKSFKFARTLSARINYNKGLVESYMNKAWIETDNKNFIEAITHASQALAIDEILENATAFTTALYIISEANYSVGDMEKGDKYKKLYQHKLMKLTQSEEQVLKSIEGLSVGMKKETDLDSRVVQALQELDSF
ncbi:MAG: tetratricopeptide repeat protein [Candidatus Hodarchaeales archaeon]